MYTLKSITMSRELELRHEFASIASQFFRAFETTENSVLLSKCYNSIFNSLRNFGVSDLYSRQVERLNVLDIDSDRKSYCTSQTSAYNGFGLVDVTFAKGFLADFITDFPPSSDPVIESDFANYLSTMKTIASYYEMNGEEITAIMGIVDDYIRIAGINGEEGVLAKLQSDLVNLENIRNGSNPSPDNPVVLVVFPYWKLVGVALLIGLSVWKVIKCANQRQCCGNVESAAEIIGFTIAALLIAFC